MMWNLTNILLAVLTLAVLCIPGVFDRFVTVLLGPIFLLGIAGLVGFVGSLGLFLAAFVMPAPVLAWHSQVLHPLVAQLWPTYVQWLQATYPGIPASLEAVVLIGLASFLAMMGCVAYVKLVPLVRNFYVKTLLRQVV